MFLSINSFNLSFKLFDINGLDENSLFFIELFDLLLFLLFCYIIQKYYNIYIYIYIYRKREREREREINNKYLYQIFFYNILTFIFIYIIFYLKYLIIIIIH